MKLHELRAAAGATAGGKRVGRGHGSGMGKTSTRGNNGQGQRSGRSIKVGHEGGQMPLYRRLPKKKHFRMPGKQEWTEVNVGQLAGFAKGAEITAETLVETGILSHARDGVRVLGSGELNVALTLKVHHVTASARQKIEAAGGTIVLLGGSSEGAVAEG
ncbi:50S ribosomal protein L15 [compost metagenome]